MGFLAFVYIISEQKLNLVLTYMQQDVEGRRRQEIGIHVSLLLTSLLWLEVSSIGCPLHLRGFIYNDGGRIVVSKVAAPPPYSQFKKKSIIRNFFFPYGGGGLRMLRTGPQLLDFFDTFPKWLAITNVQ